MCALIPIANWPARESSGCYIHAFVTKFPLGCLFVKVRLLARGGLFVGSSLCNRNCLLIEDLRFFIRHNLTIESHLLSMGNGFLVSNHRLPVTGDFLTECHVIGDG